MKTDSKLRSESKNSAMDVAKAFLENDPKREFFTPDPVGNFRLNTMLHLSQMLYCAKTGKLLFKDPMYAFPPSYHKLSENGVKELNELYFGKFEGKSEAKTAINMRQQVF